MQKLTVIIPVYNESKTILEIIDKVLKVNINKQIIVVDDCSTDDSVNKILSISNKLTKLYYMKKTW